ncbi:hypothetical protein [Pseudomonas sp. A-RE-26]|uniref:hypothetical protein n=1 Tax=Pseudomonas sp. A-RE-26 TaxID=2832402 RepID=UPI001CC1953A|nr:hypothetical protein [Pseudomonas sp. A-RE-26]
MPQPISRLYPDANIHYGNAGDRPLLQRPDLAALAMEAIASWSNVEAFMLRLFVELFGGKESLATEVFLALNGQSAKDSAIRAAAGFSLKDRPEVFQVLNAILAIAGTNEKHRNKLAHHTWGFSPNIPDGLLLVDPRTSLGKVDKTAIYVWKAADFNSIISENDELCGYGFDLRQILLGHIGNQNGEIVQALLNKPKIRERLKPLR